MLNEKGLLKGAATYQGPLSRAQFHRTVETYNSRRHPANRFDKSYMTSDGYDYDENTSASQGKREGAMFPPIHKTPLKLPKPPKRPASRGIQKLPRIKVKSNNKNGVWHPDDLQSLPYLDEWDNSTSETRLPPATGNTLRPDGHKLVPLQFVDDEQFNSSTREEQESYYNLPNEEDVEEEQNELSNGFSPDNNQGQSLPPSCLKKTKKRTKARSQELSPQPFRKPKSVRFLHASPLPPSPRPQSSRNLPPDTQSSEEFHFGPALTPLGPITSDIGQEAVLEPKVTYYNDAGEEITEEPLFQEEEDRDISMHDDNLPEHETDLEESPHPSETVRPKTARRSKDSSIQPAPVDGISTPEDSPEEQLNGTVRYPDVLDSSSSTKKKSKSRRKKDNRMKIWLTRTDWKWPVEFAE